MILLGLNGGLGNTDVGELPVTAFDLKGGWLDYPRQKTGIPRRVPRWPETLDAIRAVMANRRDPKAREDDRLLFVGRRGQSYIGSHRGYRVTQEFNRVLAKAGIEGRTFYDLRRTFQTIAEGARDLVAVQSIMGHAPASGDMSAIYRQRVDDDRLLSVVDHVRRWLFGEEESK
jgi:integrase